MAKVVGTVNIRGKEYELVASRVARFRKDHPKASLTSSIIDLDDKKILIRAEITIDGVIVATGHACELHSSSMINKTSSIENCETSAFGRALACFGYVGEEFCSADELTEALKQQNISTEAMLKGQKISEITDEGLLTWAKDNHNNDAVKMACVKRLLILGKR